MGTVSYRRARLSDIPKMAELRAADWGTEEYWTERIRGYLTHKLQPRLALRPRTCFVALEGASIIGLVAGHLTRRWACQGELEWISVRTRYRSRGVASQLLRLLAKWFVELDARLICVDVEPSNQAARSFYARHGAVDLRPHWMAWKDIGQVALG